jgi:dTDP-4-amino-4,6-dideoxygalactose transaminase
MRYRGGEGGFTEQFETALREKTGAKHALTVNSGTSALICALAALEAGPGDEVIVPAYTWVASAMAAVAVGAVPVMADIDESLTIDPEDIKRKITKHSKAVIPVHMINLPCDMDAILKLAKSKKLLVVEDACQAVGISYKGRRLGTLGDAGAFSFNMYKNITCGEGGAVLTNNERTYQRALMYHDAGAFTRNYASEVKEPFFPGVNYRVSEIQGAIMGAQLKKLDGIIEGLQKRRKIMAEIFSKSKKFKMVKHHDEAGAAAIPIIFETAKDAQAFKEKHQINLLIESGRHIYTNWEPLMEQRSFHPKMNPFKWANREIKYTKDMCQKTLDILSRAANIGIPYGSGESETAGFAKKLVA